MTSVYDANGRLHPVTVIAASDNVVLRRLTNDNDGYSAVQVGFDSQKESRVSKAELGNFKKANSEPKRFVREFRLKADLSEGEVNLTVTQFQPGDFVDVIGRSKGKGFQGVMKKHNFDGQGAAHPLELDTPAFATKQHDHCAERKSFPWDETAAIDKKRVPAGQRRRQRGCPDAETFE